MPSLAKHQSASLTKLLLLGDSGSGKTGAMTSLVKAGFKLRILDFDNGLDSLYQFCLRECPDKLDNVETVALRDPRKASALGPLLAGGPKAFVRSLELLDRWKDGDTDFGSPATWGPDCILVIDSLSFMADAAMDWAEPLTPKGQGGKSDGRAVYGMAQRALEDVIGLLTNPAFGTNVIITAHIRYTDMPDGSKKGQPNAAGQALGPIIPRYFNSVALCESKPGGTRSIKTISTGLIDLKNPAPFKMAKEYDISTGLAEFFKTVRGN